ncbi:MAG: tRNA pseudouridine(55) synthase TruB [Verrucomicrobia bacterium]|nr:tRNA pseudouridine(55) synthase TruB [Verrucomicrobiota bacterium]MBT4274136.1 tRNA pseudouridine(55) synthase TruB [Verrucomicrobiota bacterium]MBT6238920.1 tRNA pseudouridine(55) synthase TruB [Verrucomicrobiota bacterium]
MVKNATPDGILLVDKPSGMTSHDVVDAVRKRFRIKKVGHCGTLDPNATGLLILVLGKATKLSEKLMGEDKVYTGIIELGRETNSYDIDGETVAEKDIPDLSTERLNEFTQAFKGDQMQIPPMVSAIKRNGVPLYKLARKGIEVERPPRLIHIYYFRIKTYQRPECEFEVACTKGTYVRSLAQDLGQNIGCGAHLKTLRRTVSGNFKIEAAIPLDDILACDMGSLMASLLPPSLADAARP